MAIFWLVDGVLYREIPRLPPGDASVPDTYLDGNWERISPEPTLPMDGVEFSVAQRSPARPGQPAPPPARSAPDEPPRPPGLPLPPPNSEVVARPAQRVARQRPTPRPGPEALERIDTEFEQDEHSTNVDFVTVEQLMSRPVVSVAPEASLVDALQLLAEHGFTHLPVVDEGRLVGLVSDRDLLGSQAASVGQMMVRRVLTTGPGADLKEVAQALVSCRFHSLVVIDGEATPIGIVTSTDLLGYLVEHPAFGLYSQTSTGA